MYEETSQPFLSFLIQLQQSIVVYPIFNEITEDFHVIRKQAKSLLEILKDTSFFFICRLLVEAFPVLFESTRSTVTILEYLYTICPEAKL